MTIVERLDQAVAPAARARLRDPLRPVRIWLWTIAALVFGMVLLGGTTRLTESGLSITEWKPIMGVIPPLTGHAWREAFAKYQQIPQYAKLFPDMDLAGFKFIFLWEWSHRLLGRVIGLAVAAPLAWFWAKGALPAKLKPQLLGLLALGGLQGFVGWWMVASGLSGRVEVAPERLAVHMLLASITFAWIVWIVVGLTPTDEGRSPAGLRRGAGALVGLTLLQIGLGALVAGGRAGLVYNTWPLMDGKLVPPLADLARLQPGWLNLFENLTTVQFDHRLGAYVLLAAALWHAVAAARAVQGAPAARRGRALAGIVAAQALIGVTTLLLVVPIWAGLLHQATAMAVLGMAVVDRRRLGGATPPMLAAASARG